MTQILSPEPLMLLKWDQDWLYLDEDDENEDEDDLPPMLPLKDDEEGAKSEPEKTITERVKLTLQKSKKNKQTKKKQKKTGTEIKILTSNNLLTIPPILLAQTKVENNSYKLKNEIRYILYILY